MNALEIVKAADESWEIGTFSHRLKTTIPNGNRSFGPSFKTEDRLMSYATSESVSYSWSTTDIEKVTNRFRADIV